MAFQLECITSILLDFIRFRPTLLHLDLLFLSDLVHTLQEVRHPSVDGLDQGCDQSRLEVDHSFAGLCDTLKIVERKVTS